MTLVQVSLTDPTGEPLTGVLTATPWGDDGARTDIEGAEIRLPIRLTFSLADGGVDLPAGKWRVQVNSKGHTADWIIDVPDIGPVDIGALITAGDTPPDYKVD